MSDRKFGNAIEARVEQQAQGICAVQPISILFSLASIKQISAAPSTPLSALYDRVSPNSF